MKKREIALLLAALLTVSCGSTGCSSQRSTSVGDAKAPEQVSQTEETATLTEPAAGTEESTEVLAPVEVPQAPAFFPDVPINAWYRPYVKKLFDLDALPKRAQFAPDAPCSRLEFVEYLYGLDQARGAVPEHYPIAKYQDVPVGSEGYDAVMWADQHAIANGMSDTVFSPGGTLTREQGCTLLCRYASYLKTPLAAKTEAPGMFLDSLVVRDYAKSYVAACQMSGLLNGYEDGYFRPDNKITHAEAAKLACCLWDASKADLPEGTASVSTEADAYLSYYEELRQKSFGEPVPQSDPVPLSWFKDAAIVGDSVTVALQLYCASTKALGDATFLCAGSLSALNNNVMSVGPQSVHPTYKGTKMKIEDGVAASGVKNVYIMLGMNNLYVGVDAAVEDMRELVANIKAKSPNVNILIESVTPIAQGGSVLSQGLTNQKVDQFNEAMQTACQEEGWYYLDVASQFKDDEGWLKREYCGDLPGMGIHFTFAATKIWTDHLVSHVPQALK